MRYRLTRWTVVTRSVASRRCVCSDVRGEADVFGRLTAWQTRALLMQGRVKLPPLVNVTCPKCQSPEAVVAFTRGSEHKCFCSKCSYGWDAVVEDALGN